MQNVITVEAEMAQSVDETDAEKVARIKQILDDREYLDILDRDVPKRSISIGKRGEGTHAIVILVRRADDESS